MDEETSILEKMYMVHTHDDTSPCLEDDEYVGHMEPPTSTTPTSKECDYKCNNIGIGDAMIPIVYMMIHDCLHDIEDSHAMSYASFTFPCDAFHEPNVEHVESFDYDDNDMNMPSYECFTFPTIACNMLNNCSSPCIACNDDNYACVVTTLSNNCSFPRFVDNKDKILNMVCAQCLQYSSINATKMLNNWSFKCLVCNNVNMFENKKAPIALSNDEDFAFSYDKHVFTYTLHNHHEYYDILLDANGDVQIKICIMMDDVFIYHARTLFFLCFVCVGTRTTTSTSFEHELAKRALESIILVSSNSNSTCLPFTCFVSTHVEKILFHMVSLQACC
jgi:hypothetical protein